MKSNQNKILIPLLLFILASSCLAQIDRPRINNTGVTKKHSYDPSKLPSPNATESARRGSRRVDMPSNAELTMPPGFTINIFADDEFFEDRSRPRLMAEAPNGDIFVADSTKSKIVVLRDSNKDGKADKKFIFTDNVTQPFGIAFHKGFLYVGNTDSVVKFAYKDGQTVSVGAGQKLIDLPGQGYNQHWTRNLVIAPDGKSIYVTVGSKTNVSVEDDPRRAAISVYDIDGGNHRIFASGLRNPTGITIHPVTGQIWASVNERDNIGDDLVPDYVTSVRQNAFYGFPYSYIGNNIDPRRADDVLKNKKSELVKNTVVPDVLLASHSAALGLRFYNGKMFPEEYRGDLFVALHGSWNRSKLTGYKIIRIKFGKDGKLLKNEYEDFVTGWLPDENSQDVWGRPVGVLIARDGSMLISDDGARRIWRVSYKAPKSSKK